MAAAKVAMATDSVQARRPPNWMSEVGNVVHLKYTPSTSYATGGDAMDIAAALPYQVRSVIQVIFVPNAATLGYSAAWDGTNKKVLLWNGTTQATSTTDLSAAVFDAFVLSA